VALVAVGVLGAVNVFYSASVLNSTIESQLSSVGQERAVAVRSGIARLRAAVSAVARDQSVANALNDLSLGFSALAEKPVTLDPTEQQALETFYATEISRAPSLTGLSPESLLPTTDAGRYLQYHYIVENPAPDGDRSVLDDAGDGSPYSAAHAIHHPNLLQRARALGVDDLLLISASPPGAIVYTTDKNIDFATSLQTGPYADSNLADTIVNRLDSVPIGETILVDFQSYLPNDGRPTMFAVAAVRQDSQMVGAVAVSLPENVLNDILTFDNQWEDIGLGRSGEIYIVGADHLMRSVSRFWVEDPDGYLTMIDDQGYPPEVRETIERYGSTIMAQPVETKAADAALEDRTYNDTTSNYLGTKTRTIARPLRFRDLDWVIISGFSSSDATRPVRDYLWSLGLIALILVPIVALLGFLLAARITRPIKPLVDAVDSITAGDLDTRVPDLGRNEYGDLGNRINALTAMLRERDEQREATEDAIHEVLVAALPERVVAAAREAARNGQDNSEMHVGDLVDTCTVIAMSLSGYFDVSAGDTDTAVDESVSFASDLERIAGGFNIERIRSTPEESLFAAGLRVPGFAADDALRFVEAAIARFDVLDAETEEDGSYRIGIATGRVASGLQPGSQLSFGIWGPPVRTALSLTGLAGRNQVLVDAGTVEALDEPAAVEPVTVIDLQGAPVSCFTLTTRAPSGKDGSPA
jgi:class 3 adenylate cyclase